MEAADKAGHPRRPFLSSAAQFLLGDPEVFPGQTRYIISTAGSGSTLLVFSGKSMLCYVTP